MFTVTLSQMFVAALVISQVLTDPANIKNQYDPQADQQVVLAAMRKGCPAVLNQLGSEIGMELTAENSGFSEIMQLFIGSGKELPIPGLKATTLDNAYKMFCLGKEVSDPDIDLAAIIVDYNKALEGLPDLSKMKGFKLPQSTVILDVFGNRFTEVYKNRNRRVWIPLSEIPEHVTMAFISAEDSRFFQHRGVDARGILRAYFNNEAKSDAEKKRRPEGGSTITQQIVKNLLLDQIIQPGQAPADEEVTSGVSPRSYGAGDEISADRKIREMVLAARLEQLLTKSEILELYLNYVFLGRASWGVEMAAQSYFGKSIRQVDKLEGAFLAGLTKGPNFFNPNVYPDRVRGRTAYVLSQMLKVSDAGEKKFLTKSEHDEVRKKLASWNPAKPAESPFKLAEFVGPRSKGSFFFLDDVINDTAEALGGKAITEDSYVVKTTIHPRLQPIVEAALQESLAEYEIGAGRVKWERPEKNIQAEIEKFATENPDQDAAEAWHKVLQETKAPLFDVHWPIAVVVATGKNLKVGLKDGRHVKLNVWNQKVARSLKLWDIVHVKIQDNVAHLRARPQVQGAALILENRSGRVLALAGGFSYAANQFNRATRGFRQPGSTVKPLVYLAALQAGVRTNQTFPDLEIEFPSLMRGQPPWAVGPGSGDYLTTRQALERSNNQVTARLLYPIGRGNPAAGLDVIQDLCMEVQLCATRPFRGFPFALGSHEVRLVDMASFYATIANEGVRARPYYVESISLRGQEVFNAAATFREGLMKVQSVSPQVFREVKSILQGSLARGTATKLSRLAPYVGGKTGTTNDGKDVWFVGFTNEITIATWVGYDRPRTLGGDEATGGRIALPIFEKVINKVADERAYQNAPLALLNAPHPELAVASAPEPTHERPRMRTGWPAPRGYDEDRPRRRSYWAPPEDSDDLRRQRNMQRRNPFFWPW